MSEIAKWAAEPSPWSPRETELLAVTLQLLQQHGYDRLTVDAVAAKARARKATVYRRWPSKAELVVAALIEGVRQVAVPPYTGTLRNDLLRAGELICQQSEQHAGTIRAVLVEVWRNPALNDVMQQHFIERRKALINHILQQAVERGEIDRAAIDDELWDLLPHYLIFRSIIPGRPPTRNTVRTLVDKVIIPGLTRTVRTSTIRPEPPQQRPATTTPEWVARHRFWDASETTGGSWISAVTHQMTATIASDESTRGGGGGRQRRLTVGQGLRLTYQRCCRTNTT